MTNNNNEKRDVMMLGGAAACLLIATVAAVAGRESLAAMAVNVAWIFFLFRLIFAAVFYLLEESPRPRSGSRDVAQ